MDNFAFLLNLVLLVLLGLLNLINLIIQIKFLEVYDFEVLFY